MKNKNFEKIIVGKRYLSLSGNVYCVCNVFKDITNNLEIFNAIILNSTTIFDFNIEGKCLTDISDKENQNLFICLD